MRVVLRLLVVLIVIAFTSPAVAQGVPAEARAQFARGQQMFEAHDYAHALAAFRESMASYASPNPRLYIARCLRELGRLDEAATEYEIVIREAAARIAADARFTAVRNAATAELRPLESRIGRVRVTANGFPLETRVRVGAVELTVANLETAVRVMPGPVRVVIEPAGGERQQREVIVAAGAIGRAEFTFVPITVIAAAPLPPPRESTDSSASGGASPARLGGYVMLVVGVLGMGAFGTFATLAVKQFEMIDARCGMMTCPDSEIGAIDQGRTYETVANVSLAVGIVGIAAGLVLFVAGHSGSPTTPRVDVGANGLFVTGAF